MRWRLLFIVVLLYFVFRVLRYLKRKVFRRKSDIEKTPSDYLKELARLREEKQSIEEMINITKKKFHRQKIDEESFREIVRDHQKRLIEVEHKISSFEKRIKNLEERK